MSICKFIMGLNPDRIPNQNPNPSSSLYGQEQLQLRLYQAFIFSIPILFSIILFLLFYVFYLKRRTINNTINFHQTLPITSTTTTTTANNTPQPVMMRAKLQTILVDEDLIRTKDKLCSVCLGEFQIGEELHQLPSCKHVFHADCIRLWLYSSSTCPLCRTFIAHHHPAVAAATPPPPPPISSSPEEEEST